MKTKLILLTVALVGSLVSVAHAEEPAGERRQRVVSYADLDLTRSEDAAALYRRIKAAAQVVCDRQNSRAIEVVAGVRRCKEEVTARAVADVNAAELTRYYTAHRERVASLVRRESSLP
jgi:UrcA family protein